MTVGRIGRMLERLTVQSPDAAASKVSSLVASGTVATATATAAHGFATGDYVTVSGATPAGYNGKKRVTVTGATTFTYTVASGLASPATGTVRATYTTDAQGGRKATWTDVATVSAEMVALRASEQLRLAAIQSDTSFRFRVRTRTDLAEKMRLLWTPTWPPGGAERVLEITGIMPDGDGRTYQLLDAGVAP